VVILQLTRDVGVTALAIWVTKEKPIIGVTVVTFLAIMAIYNAHKLIGDLDT